ncbi:MAG: integrase arm-type DNA-binding domain-containing protein [Methylococcus sp.]|nr:integrase arm-type DNA-binding domain-containing protein [Methylococcus sp.]
MSTPAAQVAKITKTLVDRMQPPEAGQVFFRDAELKGFAVRITANGAKAFIVEKRIEGQVKRLTLGRYPELTVEQARKEAHKLLGKIASGANPIADKQKAALQATTLTDAFAAFLNARKALKPRTLYDYQRVMTVAFPDWQKKPIAAITKDMVAKRHLKLGKDHGEAYANLAMRFLRALFNFSIAQYEDSKGQALLRENPVIRLNQTRAWYRVERRQSVIKPHQLADWYKAVKSLKDDQLHASSALIADYLMFILFTGLRKQEAASLTWEAVDLQHRTLTVTDTKNREPLTLPITDFLDAILTDRLAARQSEYVFPGPGKTGFLIEPKRQIKKVREASGVDFTLHDLRRTYITVAESLDISAYALKRLVNHKMHNDVTAGYIVSDVERLREPMKRISDFLKQACLRGWGNSVQSCRNYP